MFVCEMTQTHSHNKTVVKNTIKVHVDKRGTCGASQSEWGGMTQSEIETKNKLIFLRNKGRGRQRVSPISRFTIVYPHSMKQLGVLLFSAG